MRGIRDHRVEHPSEIRISPAHAGNTSCGWSTRRSSRDQPRTCGEYRICSRLIGAPDGSAPHMRGILATAGFRGLLWGISPAHAGNTDTVRSPSRSARDQPRTCGEYAVAAFSTLFHGGSAPHMRGILTLAGEERLPARISPAHAGNTSTDAVAAVAALDQPRTCGEYTS